MPSRETQRNSLAGTIAQLIVDTAPSSPFRGSAGIINHLIDDCMTSSGMISETILVPRPEQRYNTLPVHQAELATRAGLGAPDIRIFTERGLDFHAPPRGRASNLVFFHGLFFNASTILQSENINGFCANSRYLRDVLLSLLLYPADPTTLRPGKRAPTLVGFAPLPGTFLKFPHGYPSEGYPISSAILAKIGRERVTTVFGHSIQPYKFDPFATLSIMVHLNRLAKKRRLKKDFRLFVWEGDYEIALDAAKELPTKVDVDDLLLPIPYLNCTSLYRLMRKCSFSLGYHLMPESFGLYALDSIHNETPFYTNGAGNLRHLLPPGHGIRVSENFGMAFGPASGRFRAFEGVAKSILDDHVSGQGNEDCRRGRDYVAARYSVADFENSLIKVMKAIRPRVRGARRALPREEPAYRLSPLVRMWNPDTGQITSDHQSLELGSDNEALKRVLGQRPGDLSGRTLKKLAEPLARLFRNGVLGRSLPDDEIVHLGSHY